MAERSADWYRQAQRDLEVAKVMLDSKSFSWCAFICQQSLEKLLKAGYVKREKRIPPYIHKLERLVQILRLEPPQDLLEALIRIDKYYIISRYPIHKGSMDIKTKKAAEDLYCKTKELYKWLSEEMGLK